MARPINKLSARAVDLLREPGRHSDGGGLYLSISSDGRRRWVFMFRRAGKQREMGLGSVRDVSLGRARELARDARELLASGRDPMEARRIDLAVPTFGEFADALVEDIAGGFRNPKHVAQWKMTLGAAYCSSIRGKLVSQITTEDVLGVLKSAWMRTPETASRLRGRIERVLDAAKARGLRSGENPARWRGHLQTLLPMRPKLTRGHHKALPYEGVPAFFHRLSSMRSSSAEALAFLILTAGRSAEVLGARWGEFDLSEKIWTIPAARMKAGRLHRVPLTDAALEILARMSLLGEDRAPTAFVFPGSKAGLSTMALAMVLRRMNVRGATVHGFRSSFRDWAAEETNHPREVAEAALAHIVGDETERAYRRGDALAKRRELMEAWGRYLAVERRSNVVPMRSQAGR